MAASRQFVCVRPATYESEAEATALERLFTGRTGALENSVFAVLGPDGEQRLVRPGRSPGWSFSDAGDMARELANVAGRYSKQEQAPYNSHLLPSHSNLRLALNVAACDSALLVVVVGSGIEEEPCEHARTLAELAWSPRWIGRFHYAHAQPTELDVVSGTLQGPGILVVRPDPFGLRGELLARADLDSQRAELQELLESGSRAAGPASTRDEHAHVRSGMRRGIRWQSVIPVTDTGGPRRGRGEASDRRRGRR